MVGVRRRSTGHEGVSRGTIRGVVRRFLPTIGVAAATLAVGVAVGYVVYEPAGSTIPAVDLVPFGSLADWPVLDVAARSLALLAVLVAGGFTLGIVTVGGLLYRGYVFGATVKTLVAGGMAATDVVVLLAPHAVLELAGMVLAAAVGLHVAAGIFGFLRGERAEIVTPDDVGRSLGIVATAVVLVLVAALVEIHVIPGLV